MIRYGSVCSGIEAASVAWHQLGWRAAFFAEIEPFPRAVLAQRWPDVPCHGDFTTIGGGNYEPIDLLVGGTPCQDFSVAGLRAGLAGNRGNLTLEFAQLARRLRPRWLVWENVPGILSIDEGRAFGAFLGLLGQCGYGFAYRICDAQYFGVPQRRRRVFVVGYLGDWRPAAAVLFEPASLRGNPAPSRESGQGIARPIAGCASGGSGYRNDADTADNLIARSVRAQSQASHRADSDTYVAIDARNGSLGDQTIPVQSGGDCKRGYSLNTIPLAFGGESDGSSARNASDIARPITGRHGDPGFVAATARCVATGSNGQRYDDYETETLIAGHFEQNSMGGRGTLGWADGEEPLRPIKPQSDHQMIVTHSLRADGFDASEDGTGRGTPLVIKGAAIGREPENGPQYGEILGDATETSGCLQHKGLAATGNEAGTLLQSRMSVRRLTPRECERLQGFPEDKKSAMILTCGSMQHAKIAAQNFSITQADRDWPVALRVLIDLEREVVLIHRAEKLIWSASNADKRNPSRLSMSLDDFVHLGALMTRAWEPTIRDGKAASQVSTLPSTPRWNGNLYAAISGEETAALANDAVKFTSVRNQCLKFTTSGVGQNSLNLESNRQILSCCVATAINGFIPEEMCSANIYGLDIETTKGYTLIAYNGRLAADGPRYRALGNSMAVPCMRWIGERIELINNLLEGDHNE
jgi:DNA (cytosine-5)-methyltransferase 1